MKIFTFIMLIIAIGLIAELVEKSTHNWWLGFLVIPPLSIGCGYLYVKHVLNGK